MKTQSPGPFPLSIMHCGDHSVIVTNHGSHFAKTFDPAAARLISAAPDLMEALEGARIALTAYKNWMALHTDGKTDFPFGIKAEEKAREAIRKAKGEI